MKKFTYLFLTILVITSLAGCTQKEKNDSTPALEVTNSPTTFEETATKNEPQYESEYFSSKAFYSIISQFYYLGDTETKNNILALFNAINGKILDAYTYKECIYFLTNNGLYCVNRLLIYTQPLNIDVKDNTSIEMIGNNFIVLSNSSGDYSIYKNKDYQTVYTECTPSNFKLNSGEQMLISSSDIVWDFLHVIKDFSDKSIKASTYSILDIYTEDERFGLEFEGQYPFSEELSGKVSECIVPNYHSDTRGFLLLDNNTLVHIEPQLKTFGEKQIIGIHNHKIDNVEKVFATNNERQILVTKTNEPDSLFLYTYPFDFESSDSATEIKYLLPDFTTADIESFISHPQFYNELGYLKLKDGRYFSYNQKGDITEDKILAEALNNKTIIDYVTIDSLYCFLMDDGNIYAYLNENLITNYNLK